MHEAQSSGLEELIVQYLQGTYSKCHTRHEQKNKVARAIIIVGLCFPCVHAFAFELVENKTCGLVREVD